MEKQVLRISEQFVSDQSTEMLVTVQNLQIKHKQNYKTRET